MNDRGITLEDVMANKYGACIGSFRNKWRERFVEIYSLDDLHVVTVGYPTSGAPIVCVEERSAFQRNIGKFDVVIH